MRERSKDKLCARSNRYARHLVQRIRARTVPLHKLAVNMLGPGKGMVALGIGRVDVLPGWKNEHVRVIAIGPKCGVELRCRKRRSLVKHGKGLDNPSVEEDPARLTRMSVILLGIATKNLLSE